MENHIPSTIAEKYKVVRGLGSGAVGHVYLVSDPEGKLIALKLLDKSFTEKRQKAVIERFKAEFSILREFSHPGVGRVYDFGLDERLGQYFFTAEYIEGCSFLEAVSGADAGQIEELFVQALRALEYLHSRGIVHCDIKSANMMVEMVDDAEKHVRIIDFGLAVLGSPDRVVGTPAYMAPEVILKNRPDSRADLYSLGVLIYSALTGSNPFKAEEMAETFSRQINTIPDPPSRFRPEAKPYLDEIVLKLLAKNPSERFPTAAHAIRAINFGSGKGYPVETKETFLGYLPTEGNVVGRRFELSEIRGQLLAVARGEPEIPSLLCLKGDAGTGKKRLLTELKYFAQLNDVRVLELAATDGKSLEVFGCGISDCITDPGRPTLVACHVIGIISTDRSAAKIIGLLREAIHRALRWRSVAGIRSMPKVIFAFTSKADELPLIMHILDLEEDKINIVEVKNFDEEETGRYLSSLTGVAELPQKLVAGLFSRTGGNPLFLTEVIRALIDRGILYDRFGRWNSGAIEDLGFDLDSLGVPTSLSGILEKTYEGLQPEEKGILELLAVWHRPVALDGLESVLPVRRAGPPAGILAGLVRADVVTFDGSASAYSIRNPLLREVVYSGMDEKIRYSTHSAVAGYLKGHAPDQYAEIMWHRGRSEDLKGSIDALLDLGSYYLKNSRPLDAISSLTEANERIRGGDYRRGEILLHLGEANVLARRYDDAIDIYERLLAYQEEGPGTEKITTYQKLGVTYLRSGDIEKARAILGKAIGYLEGLPAKRTVGLRIENLLARCHFLEGEIDKSIERYQKTKSEWLRLSDDEKREVTNNDLAHVYLKKGELGLAEKELVADIEFFQEIGAENELERSYYSMAEMCVQRGDLERGVDYFNSAIEIAKKMSDSEILLRAYNGLGNVHTERGDREKAVYWYDRGLDLALRTGEDSTAAAIAINIGLIKAQEKDLSQALSHFKSAINIFTQAGTKTPLDLAYLLRADIEAADICRLEQDFEGASLYISEAERLIGKNSTLESERTLFDEVRNKLAKDREDLKEDDMSVKNYRYLLEINKYLSGETDLNFVLRTILKYALELSGAGAGLVLLVDKDSGLRIQASCNLKVDENLSEISVNIARSAIDKDRVIVTSDARADERFKAQESVMLLGLRSVICIPIHSRKRVIGVMYLENRSKPEVFLSADKDLLEAFADQAGIAIENAQMFSEHEAAEKRLREDLTETSVRLGQLDSQLKEQARDLERRYQFDRIVSVSPKMKEIFSLLEKISATELSICISGESGTGKELVAKAVHYNSNRKDGPFVPVNCGAIPATLIESELFGYIRGAFTGAAKDKMGLFEAASNGTIFLDEITELDVTLQSRLLRVIQEREVMRVGDTKPKKCNVRVVCATNRDLDEAVKGGKLREDLYFRIAEVRINIPPLRERAEDIPILIDEFISDYCRQHSVKKVPSADKSFIRACLSYDWPGNIRELENAVRVATAMAEKGRIMLETLPAGHVLKVGHRGDLIRENVRPGADLPLIDSYNRYSPAKTWKDYEAEIIASAYRQANYNAQETSKHLDLAIATVYKKIGELGLKDRSNPLFEASFRYEKGVSLDEYVVKIFRAAWEYADRHPYQAIRALGVSQGYFYKVMKRF